MANRLDTQTITRNGYFELLVTTYNAIPNKKGSINLNDPQHSAIRDGFGLLTEHCCRYPDKMSAFLKTLEKCESKEIDGDEAIVSAEDKEKMKAFQLIDRIKNEVFFRVKGKDKLEACSEATYFLSQLVDKASLLYFECNPPKDAGEASSDDVGKDLVEMSASFNKKKYDKKEESRPRLMGRFMLPSWYLQRFPASPKI